MRTLVEVLSEDEWRIFRNLLRMFCAKRRKTQKKLCKYDSRKIRTRKNSVFGHFLRSENAKKRNTDNTPVNITNLLPSPTSQNGYTPYLQALEQYSALRDNSYTQSTSQKLYSFLQSSLFNYNVISNINTEEQK